MAWKNEDQGEDEDARSEISEVTVSDIGSSMDMSSSQGGGSTAPSVFSFDATRDGDLFFKAHGRSFNAQNTLYTLPADDLEYSRLDKQHMVHFLSVGGLYQAPELVRRILAAEDGVEKRVLDCGTGGGNWAIAMAEEFPHAQVIGVDLAPRTGRPPPPNCRFEFDDITLGMPHYHGTFDLIHARSTANGISDYPALIEELVKCLKPGGILLLAEGDLQLYNEDKEPMEAAFNPNSGSWMMRILFETYNILKFRGSAIDAGRYLYPWLLDNPKLENKQSQKIFTPIGPWASGLTEKETHVLKYVGELMRQNSMEFVRAWRPTLIEEGYSGETIDRWIAGTDEELLALSVHMYVQWHYACATRKIDEEPTAQESMDVEI